MFLTPIRDHDRLRAEFRWRIPSSYNIGVAIADHWARRDPARPAVLDLSPGSPQTMSFGALRERSNRLAHALRRRGVGPGDRVAVFLPQCADLIVAHAAVYKLGAIVVPLAAVFGVDALSYRLADAGARIALTDAAGAAKLIQLDQGAGAPDIIVSTAGRDGAVLGLDAMIEREPADFEAVATGSDDPALMIYTSGTTGQPKGALHAHRVLLGQLPGIAFSHDGFPAAGDMMWTPADWAWAGGLLNAVLPALQWGVPVVARRGERFEPDAAFALLSHHGIRNAFIPPTALRLMRAERPAGARLGLRTLTSAGEALGAETQAWVREAFGVEVNDVYGQTECNYVLGSAWAAGVGRSGAIGRAISGHDVAVIRPDGMRCEVDEPGEIAVARPDPAMFLGYWNQPEATEAKFIGRWMRTGDQATTDAGGYVAFLGRTDDIITSSGFRIGPGEIEDCLLRHEAVAEAGAVGKPDEIRTEIVKVFVVLRDGFAPSAALADDLKRFVRKRLSAHEYPREVAFVPALPMTATGKIMRRVLRERA